MTPTPRTRWYQSQASVEHLRELLADPVLQQAQSLLLDEQMPGMDSLSGKTIEQVLKQHAYLAGFRDAFRFLEGLTHHPKKFEVEPLKEWSHYGDAPTSAT